MPRIAVTRLLQASGCLDEWSKARGEAAGCLSFWSTWRSEAAGCLFVTRCTSPGQLAATDGIGKAAAT